MSAPRVREEVVSALVEACSTPVAWAAIAAVNFATEATPAEREEALRRYLFAHDAWASAGEPAGSHGGA